MYGTFPCGKGYQTGSKSCGQCETGYYLTSQGTCSECPASAAWNTLILPIIYLLVGLVILAIVSLGATFSITKFYGGKFARSASQVLQFLLWSWMSLQTLIQVTRSLSPGAPDWLYSFYAGLSALRFERIVAHPSCLASIPFQSEWSKYGTIITMYAVVAVYSLVNKGSNPKLNAASGTSFVSAFISSVVSLLLVLYATVANSVLEVLSCSTTVTTIRSYFTLDGNGQTAYSQYDFPPETWQGILAYIHDGVLQPSSIMNKLDLPLCVSVMRIDTHYVCYEGTHTPISIASWIMLIIYTVGFPIVTFHCVRKYAIAHLSKYLKGADIEWARQHWFAQVSLFNLACCFCKRGDLHSSHSSSPNNAAIMFRNPV